METARHNCCIFTLCADARARARTHFLLLTVVVVTFPEFAARARARPAKSISEFLSYESAILSESLTVRVVGEKGKDEVRGNARTYTRDAIGRDAAAQCTTRLRARARAYTHAYAPQV